MKKLIIPFLLLIITSSCGKIMLGLVTKESINSQVKILENRESKRTIVFMPMVHLGKASYYDSAKRLIDSLRQKNYVVFYESIGLRQPIDSASLDTLDRKFRKLLGFHLSKSYKDSTNLSLPKALRNSNYAMQDYKVMGVTKTDKLVDLPKDELIKRYEEEIKPIQLLKCDYTTPLLEKYKCKDTVKHNSFYAIETLRNEYIVGETLDSKEMRVIMIYGKAHWKFIWLGLRDAGFEIIQGEMFNGIF